MHFVDVPADDRQLSTSRYFQTAGLMNRRYVHPRTFWRTLGITDYEDMDFSEVEQPTLVHDLNRPVPASWRGRYGLVLDGGTIEHVFDTRTALANLTALVKVGGRVLHVSPIAGWVNHGFYQFSPCFFFDFYQANGFTDFTSYIVRQRVDALDKPAEIIPYEHSEKGLAIERDGTRSLFVFLAEKAVNRELCIPPQGVYAPLRSPRLETAAPLKATG